MLDTTQLRHGNWLYDAQHGCYCIVSEVNRGMLKVKRYPALLYEPDLLKLRGIVIIRDNLSLAKFEPGKGNFHERTVSDKHLVIAPLENETYGWWVNEEFVKEIHYMHELQNAFEENTGQLLELNMYGAKHL
ncbi:hypothetical protein [Terrimonas ferruginea]|uniref:hypothetical protein n=1 Tax=Terrimonas ferruginea TaxID=249 RepID=UPI0012DF7A05|nr:hypothetical protein [Terrimonas ferruginea]